ncbi:MAG TPA: GNAT family N-acetyltransferase [Actinomycetales bacterium]|nr:GNAT family N-acetyltransferase [Actinomycetales bacterium]
MRRDVKRGSVRIGPADVGARVVVRYRLDDGGATDVVGELTAAAPDGVTVQPDAAPGVFVPAAAVVAAKTVPARTVTPSSAPEAVERVATLGWPGLETRRLGGWLLRAAGGFTRRANSALATGDPGLPLDEALDAVREFYAGRELPASIQIAVPLEGDRRWPDTSSRDLLAAIVERGWSVDEPTLFMTADLRAGVPNVDLPPGYEQVEASEPDEAWLGLYEYHDAALPPVARAVMTAAPHQVFTSVRTERRTVAVGRLAVAAGWAGVSAMQVAADQQRRGLGRAVLAALLNRGRADGARFAYLQVMKDNTAARRLYESVGFTTHHAYHYLKLPPTSA